MDTCAARNAGVATELAPHPAIRQLATVPRVGPVFASGIGAEIGNRQRFLKGHKWDKQRKPPVPAICATPKMPSPRSPTCGGPAPPPLTLKLRIAARLRPSIATCATTSSKPLARCARTFQATPTFTQASTNNRPNTITSGLWSSHALARSASGRPARASASLSVCYTATSPIALRSRQEPCPFQRPSLTDAVRTRSPGAIGCLTWSP